MKNIVVIGGGTGTYTVLKGLKEYNLKITAIVSMADDGGSTGILRDEFGILPPGDIRKCIVALSESSETMKEIFQYRFKTGCVNGHNLGNLLITALEDITGNYEKAITEASKILNIKGLVLPITFSNCRLCARLENNELIEGETNIDIPKHNGNLKIEEIFLKPEAIVNPKAIESIEHADLIIIGPGDLYSSLLCNLIIKGIPEAIKSSKAKKIFICNLMTKFGETNNFKLSNFINELERYLGKNIIDYILVNESEYNQDLLKKYSQEKAFPVEIDINNNKIIKTDLITEPVLIRHNSNKLAKEIFAILNKTTYSNPLASLNQSQTQNQS